MPVLPAFGLYIYLARFLDFIQDDAYITFRYIANHLNGHGLVYNIGEQIEGFTNFGWTIYLLLWGSLGFDYITVAKYSGMIFGALSLALIYMIASRIFEKENKWFAVLPVYLVAANFAFAYWSPAGLESSAFTFLTLLSVHLYLQKNWLLAAVLALAVWVRPEGALVAIILVIIESITGRKFPRFTFVSAWTAFIVSLPFLAFKTFYYGSILPNPFYAKTGFDVEQLKSGLEYAGQFFQHYGFWGLGLIVALLFYKKLTKPMKVMLIFSLIYTGYIVFIGGDVLKVHRFFLPIFGMTAILTAVVLHLIFARFNTKSRNLLLFVSALWLLWLTYRLPYEEVAQYNTAEKEFVSKMSFLSNEMKRTDSTNFSVAIGTIGKFGYELMGHDIIDVLGLTDSTIARHSQSSIEGLKTTWKERKFNVKYILERAPDYIVFSTGAKPSSPAEKALFMYPAFFESYDPIPYSRKADPKQLMGSPISAFKKVNPVTADWDSPYPLQYVEYFKMGLEKYLLLRYNQSLAYFDSALSVSPLPYNRHLLYQKSFALGKIGAFGSALPILNGILAEDSQFVFAHRDLYLYERTNGDSAKAAIHERWIKKMAPWYWDEIKQIVEFQILRKQKRK